MIILTFNSICFTLINYTYTVKTIFVTSIFFNVAYINPFMCFNPRPSPSPMMYVPHFSNL